MSGTAPDKASRALSNDTILRRIASLLKPIDRVRLVGVCHRWDALLLEHTSFDGAPAGRLLGFSTLAFICRRAGSLLRSLDVSSPACQQLTGTQVVIALELAAAASTSAFHLSELIAWRPDRSSRSPTFALQDIERLHTICPQLSRASCALVIDHHEQIARAVELLHGPLRMLFDGYCMSESLGPEGAAALSRLLSSSISSSSSASSSPASTPLPALQPESSATAPKGATLASLDCVACPIGDSGLKHLAKALSSNKTLTSLHVVDCSVGPEGAEALADALSAGAGALPTSNASTRSAPPMTAAADLRSATQTPLSVGSRTDTPLSFAGRLQTPLSMSTRLYSAQTDGGRIQTCLPSGSRSYTSLHGSFLVRPPAARNHTLTSLSLASNSDIGELGARHLARALSLGSVLRTLDLTSCHIGPGGARAIANALLRNWSLTSLVLGLNDIYTEGAAAFSGVLSSNVTLRMLDLHSNEIGDDGAALIAEGLAENNTLTTIVLYDNDIGDSGARVLAEALAANVSLTKLDLRANDVGEEAQVALAEALEREGLDDPRADWVESDGDELETESMGTLSSSGSSSGSILLSRRTK